MKSLLSALLRICPRSLRNSVRGKLRWQPFFERLHEIALVGMNYEEGFLIEISGELDLLARIHAAQTGDRPCVIFDVGANVGKYSQAALKIFGDRCRIHAFEPAAATADKFVANLGADSRVTLHHLALSDAVGVAKLYFESEGSPVATLNSESLDGMYGHSSSIEEVQTTTLDALCNGQGIDRIHLLKMDAEGHEFQILKGAGDLLAAGRIDGIQWEFGYQNVYSRVFFRDFFELLSPQYHLFRLVKDGLYPLGSAYSCEVFRTINYYARLKTLPPLPSRSGSSR
ncbi:MAG TPA: FkbM family methyltransferase [Planctomycetaceae bacterium]|nr:FkbM family methyltransferase [Planctomycetaceae bacterium]